MTKKNTVAKVAEVEVMTMLVMTTVKVGGG